VEFVYSFLMAFRIEDLVVLLNVLERPSFSDSDFTFVIAEAASASRIGFGFIWIAAKGARLSHVELLYWHQFVPIHFPEVFRHKFHFI